jgi:hypothetical protein
VNSVLCTSDIRKNKFEEKITKEIVKLIKISNKFQRFTYFNVREGANYNFIGIFTTVYWQLVLRVTQVQQQLQQVNPQRQQIIQVIYYYFELHLFQLFYS